MYGVVVCPKCRQIQAINIEKSLVSDKIKSKSYECNGCRRRWLKTKVKIHRRVEREYELKEALTSFKEEWWSNLKTHPRELTPKQEMVKVVILGVAQDGGMPQAGCKLACCSEIQSKPELWKSPVSLGILENGNFHLVEATRMIGKQLSMVGNDIPESVWITHAHLGHIDGLGQFGIESMNTEKIVLHCSEKLSENIVNTPSLKLLLENGNIIIGEWKTVENRNLKITPIEIPHRDELSDNHALLIEGRENKLLFMPDHDSWDETLKSVEFETIREWLKAWEIDIALIDGTFWNDKEIKNRSQKEVKHPPIEETLKRIGESKKTDSRIVFVHLNHTNPVFNEETEEYKKVIGMGWEIGKEGMSFNL